MCHIQVAVYVSSGVGASAPNSTARTLLRSVFICNHTHPTSRSILGHMLASASHAFATESSHCQRSPQLLYLKRPKLSFICNHTHPTSLEKGASLPRDEDATFPPNNNFLLCTPCHTPCSSAAPNTLWPLQALVTLSRPAQPPATSCGTLSHAPAPHPLQAQHPSLRYRYCATAAAVVLLRFLPK